MPFSKKTISLSWGHPLKSTRTHSRVMDTGSDDFVRKGHCLVLHVKQLKSLHGRDSHVSDFSPFSWFILGLKVDNLGTKLKGNFSCYIARETGWMNSIVRGQWCMRGTVDSLPHRLKRRLESWHESTSDVSNGRHPLEITPSHLIIPIKSFLWYLSLEK